jgi:hypothetical protein
MPVDLEALAEALRAHKQVMLIYTKKDKATGLHTGDVVTHTGGLHEIKPDGTIWLWDTSLNDTIRQFKPEGVNSYEVLATDFVPVHPEWGFKLMGEIIP